MESWKDTGLRCILIRAHCGSKLAGQRYGVPYCHANHRVESLSLSCPLGTIARWVGISTTIPPVLARRYQVQDNTLATHPRTVGEFTEDDNNMLLVEVRVQTSQAAEGALPSPVALQEKTSARSPTVRMVRKHRCVHDSQHAQEKQESSPMQRGSALLSIRVTHPTSGSRFG